MYVHVQIRGVWIKNQLNFQWMWNHISYVCIPIQYWVGVKVCATTKSGPKRKENWICYFSLFLLRKKIFVLQAFFDINDKTYSIGIGTIQLIPTPIDIFGFNNFAIWINTMFVAKIHYFLGFFYTSNERASNRNSANL